VSAPSITLDSADKGIPLLQENGYILVRDVLSAEQVKRARAIFDSYLLSDDNAENSIEATDLLQIPEMNFIFDERVIKALKVWLGGTLTYYPNYAGRLNRRTEWHLDHGFSPEFLPEGDHLYDPQFRHAQCIVYLQDNPPGPGGGLDVKPESHKWAATGDFPYEEFVKRAYPDVISIDSEPGDLVVFDGRLMHRGTPQDGSRKLRKYGIHWSASRNDRVQADRFIGFLMNRAANLKANNAPPDHLQLDSKQHRVMHSINFPGSYLPEAIQSIRKHAVATAEIPNGGAA
jgi:Phytanoyl-CoA dioxygenase (PhyH)